MTYLVKKQAGRLQGGVLRSPLSLRKSTCRSAYGPVQLLAEHPAGAAASAAQVADEAAGHPLFIDALVQHAAARSAALRSEPAASARA